MNKATLRSMCDRGTIRLTDFLLKKAAQRIAFTRRYQRNLRTWTVNESEKIRGSSCGSLHVFRMPYYDENTEFYKVWNEL